MQAIKSAVLAAVALATAAPAAALLLSGCSTTSKSVNPVDWWHSLEGGRIAAQRPPPPNADAPYPGLDTIPPRPAPTDTAALGKISGALLTERANADYAGKLMPVVPPGAAKLPAPPPSDTPSASLLAASASPAAAPRRAAAGGQGSAAQPGAAGGARRFRPADIAALTMPDKPPPAPRIEGVPSVTAPTLPPVAPPAPPAAPKASVAGTSLQVPFQPGTAGIATGHGKPPARTCAEPRRRADAGAGLR